MRYPLVIGNWKLNGNTKMVKDLIKDLRDKLNDNSNCNVAIAPPMIYLMQAQEELTGSKILLSAQNVDINLYGAFTGETSAQMLKDIGVKYVIIGHSERRMHHKEDNEYIAKKFAILKSQQLIPILCIGETKEENSAGITEQICAQQIDIILNKLGVNSFENTVIAYEPIWAIGTGESPPPTKVQIIHKFIRNYIARYDLTIAKQIIIQYGGSVNADNAIKLFNQPDIDGVLVGGASLKINTFIKIINAAILVKTKSKLIV